MEPPDIPGQRDVPTEKTKFPGKPGTPGSGPIKRPTLAKPATPAIPAERPTLAGKSKEPVPDLQKLVNTLDGDEKQFAQSETDFINEKFGDKPDTTPEEITDAVDERETALLNKNIDPDADFSKISTKEDIPSGQTVEPTVPPVRPGIQEEIPPTGTPKVDTAKTGEGPRTIGGLTEKELAIGAGGAGAGGLAGLALGSGNAKDLLQGVAGRNGIPGEIQKIIKGILDGPDSPEKTKIEKSINDIIDNEKNIDKSNQGAKVALQIFNQPSVSQVENNQNKSNLDTIESKVKSLRSQLTERVGRLSRQSKLARASLDRRRRRKDEQESLKRRVERDEKLVTERFDRLSGELAGIIRPSLAGDSMRKPVNVNIVNRIQSPSNVQGTNQKVNDGVLQKGKGHGKRIKPMKQPRIKKLNDMESNEFLMKKNDFGVLREKIK